jgi:hypothetical protein
VLDEVVELEPEVPPDMLGQLWPEACPVFMFVLDWVPELDVVVVVADCAWTGTAASRPASANSEMAAITSAFRLLVPMFSSLMVFTSRISLVAPLVSRFPRWFPDSYRIGIGSLPDSHQDLGRASTGVGIDALQSAASPREWGHGEE